MRSNKERSIERYINGRMGPAEQREFLKLAERDPSIRRMLKAEQVIGNAIARDRAALPLIAMEPSTGLLSKLAVTKPAGVGSAAGAGGGTAGSGGAGIGAGSTGAGSGVAGSAVAGSTVAGSAVAGGAATGSGIIGSLLLGSKVAQVIVAVVGISGIAVGTFMVAPIIQRSAGRSGEPAPLERKMELRAAPAPQVNAGDAVETPLEAAPPSTAMPKDAESRISAPEGTAAAPQSGRTSLASRRSAPQETQAKPAAKEPAAGTSASKQAEPPPPEIEDPKARLNIRVERNK